MSDQIVLLKNIKNMLSDLVYINGVIATELVRITENTAAIRRGEEFLNESSCVSEHNQLNKCIIDILKKYKFESEMIVGLEKHVLRHLEKIE